jgi:hypothetical protein
MPASIEYIPSDLDFVDGDDSNNSPKETELGEYISFLGENENEEEYVMIQDSYNPFTSLDYTIHPSVNVVPSTTGYANKNQLAFSSNISRAYIIDSIGEYGFLVSNDHIFPPLFMQTIRDLASAIEIEDTGGNIITNLTIDPEVANALFDLDPIDSGNYIFSGLTEYREQSNRQYENDIRNIRGVSVVFSSPEFRELMEETFRGGSFGIVDLSPNDSPELPNLTEDNLRELE